MEVAGLFNYFFFSICLAGIYAVMALGLNVQWGYTGILNIGVAAFFQIGAYTTALLTSPDNPAHIGGFDLPGTFAQLVGGEGSFLGPLVGQASILIGLLGGMAVAALLGFLIGWITIGLRSDYLAIASIGISEIVRLFIQNEGWLTNGTRGIAGIPRPGIGLYDGSDFLEFMVLVVVCIALVYFLIERAYRAPWGRVLRAVRENEDAVLAAGKDVTRFRLQAFVFGCTIMGLAGGLYAHFTTFVSPEAFRPDLTTFLVWVMLIAGGSGNNRGAILGAFAIWAVWSGSEFITSAFPVEYVTQIAPLRVLLIGVILQIVLLTRQQGLLPERPPKPIHTDDDPPAPVRSG